MLKRAMGISIFVAAALAIGPAAFAAGNPHFIKNLSSATLDGANLVVSFKEAGLPSGAVETVTVTATETVTYECVNGGGMNPSASNKKSITRNVSESGTFTADQNGNIVGSLTLEPLSAAQVGFACPPGQTTTFVSATYSNVLITDSTSGASLAFRGTFSYTNPDAPPLR
jgi:hypothetical protein